MEPFSVIFCMRLLKAAAFGFQWSLPGDLFVIPAKIADIFKAAGVGRLRDGAASFGEDFCGAGDAQAVAVLNRGHAILFAE